MKVKPGNPNPSPETRFKPGVSGNPGGKPVNARNQLTKQFLNVLAEDFRQHGKSAVEAMRVEDPSGYIKAIAGLLPKEFIIERPLEGLSDDELAAAVEAIRTGRVSVEGAGNGTGDEALSEPSANVLPV